jgi:hypothetical protein
MTKHCVSPYFNTKLQITRRSAIMHTRFPLSLRDVEDMLHDREYGSRREYNAIISIL